MKNIELINAALDNESVKECIAIIEENILLYPKLNRADRIKELSKIRTVCLIRSSFDGWEPVYTQSKKLVLSKLHPIIELVSFIDAKIAQFTLESVLNTEFFKNDMPIANSVLTKDELVILFHHLREKEIIPYKNNTKLGLLISQMTNYSERISDDFSNINDILNNVESKKKIKKLLSKIIKDLD